MSDPLRRMIERASDFVDKRFRQTGQIARTYHAITADGDQLVTPALDDDKDADAILIRALFAMRKVVRYIVIDEAWILDRKHGPIPPPAEMEWIARHGLRNHPDRREVVMISGEDIHGARLIGERFILRPEHGRATLSPLRIIDMTEGRSEGRMVGLLDHAKR